MSIRALSRAAEGFGLVAETITDQAQDLHKLAMPLIVHWKHNHFVVVEDATPTQFRIVDPKGKRETLEIADFSRHYGGVGLAFRVGASFVRKRITDSSRLGIQYVASIFRLEGIIPLLGQLLLATVLLQAVGLATPIFTKIIVDGILPSKQEALLPVLGLGIAATVIAIGIASYLRGVLIIRLQSKIDPPLMLGFFERLVTLPYSFFMRRTSGDLLMRLNSNMTLREIVTGHSVSTVLDASTVIVYAAILVGVSPPFAAIVIAMGLLQVLVLLMSTRRMHHFAQLGLETQSRAQSYQIETFRGILAVKAAGGEPHAISRWTDLFYDQLRLALERTHFSTVVSTVLTCLRALAPMLFLWVGAHYVLAGTMSLGTVMAITALATSFLSPLTSLASTIQQFQVIGAHIERLADVYLTPPEQQATSKDGVQRLAGRVELRRVGFRYDSHTPNALRGISIRIEPGQKIGIAGRTGSGKSTLGLVILGLLQKTEGELFIDGKEQSEYSLQALRAQMGVVLQETSLFSGTIGENIRFNKPGVTQDDITWAARIAEIHDDIQKMPMGYATQVAEAGATLSGGQRQRIALARALVNRPAVLLLDEATSDLDMTTEAQIDKNLSSLACTRIVIAHRLSTLLSADQVIVLEEGRVVEQGSPNTLVGVNGSFASMLRSGATRDVEAGGQGMATA